MIRKLAIICICSLIIGCSTSDKEQRQRIPDGTYRPSGFHAFITHGTGNEPISLLKTDTLYHLFYTTETDEWGHLTSNDMLSWQPAISFPIPEHGYGEVIWDENNLTNLNAPWNILWSDGEQLFLNYSQDGIQWTDLENPVLRAKGLPSIVWSEDLEQWILTLTNENGIFIFTSQNLTEWTTGNSITSEGALKSWLIDMDDEWILLTQGTKHQYQLGSFDGSGFQPTSDRITIEGIDSGIGTLIREGDENIIVTKNRTSNNQLPTFSTPLALALKDQKLKIRPLKAMQSQIVSKRRARLNRLLTDGPSWYNFAIEEEFEVMEIVVSDATSEVRMLWDKNAQTISISGSALASDNPTTMTFKNENPFERVVVDLLIDHASVDFFLNDGDFATSLLTLPDSFFSKVEVFLNGEKYDAKGILYDIGV
ncbi:hypothetical protein [Ekhidna sp. To15]|uniref:hypothetical protein n=1 Tax=Ekhidna sp. To15 TaxID=3395267 RepID=UPI003F522EFF